MMASPGLERPLELLAKGELEEAALACERLVAEGVEGAAACNLRGVVALRQRNLDLARACFMQAIELGGGAPGAWFNLGVCDRQAEDHEAAVRAFSKALELKPVYPKAAFHRASAQAALGRHELAVSDFERVLELSPDDAKAWSGCGASHLALGRNLQAAECYERAARLRPAWAHPLLQAGRARSRNGQAAQALVHLEEALCLSPRDPSVHFALALAHEQLGSFPAALQCLDRAQALLSSPLPAALLLARGNVLTRAGEYGRALESFDETIRLYPDLPHAHCNRALALDSLDRIEEARAGYQRARQLAPHLPEVHLDLGRMLAEFLELEAAEQALCDALAIQPGSASAGLNLGLVHLMKGALSSGWALYENRLRERGAPAVPKLARQLPRWSPSETVEGTLVWGEQGIGDQILHGSLLRSFAQAHGSVTVALDPRLVPLFERSLPGLRFVSLNHDGRGLGCSHQLPIGSLGGVVRTSLQSFQEAAPAYLQPDPCMVRTLRSELGVPPGRRVCGISWKTIRRGRLDPKSIPLRELVSGLPGERLMFVNLQYGDVQDELQALRRETGVEILQLPSVDNSSDLDRLAALVAACDIVLTSSNSTAHLAGALGRPTCVLLHRRYGRIWYWVHRQGRRSLWYPSVQVFIQKKPGSWHDVVRDAAHAMQGAIDGEPSRVMEQWPA